MTMNFPTRVDELVDGQTIEVRQQCCASWAQAHVGGSDFDDYFFPLIRYRPLEGPGKPMIGQNLPPIARCPWCGAIKAAKRPD